MVEGHEPMYLFNTFFMEKLIVVDKGYNYNNVKRYLKIK
jgi:Ulp1 family protease